MYATERTVRPYGTQQQYPQAAASLARCSPPCSYNWCFQDDRDTIWRMLVPDSRGALPRAELASASIEYGARAGDDDRRSAP
jgi:hypothetical protein